MNDAADRTSRDRATSAGPGGASPAARKPPGARADYRHFQAMTTRWSDNDAYGHVNNTVYLQWFDTTVNRFLIRRGLLDVTTSPVIALMAENGCRYHSQVAYPDDVAVGMRVGALGRSSVRYECAAFRDAADLAAAEGFFVHVYVARQTMRPVPIPEAVRAALLEITP